MLTVEKFLFCVKLETGGLTVGWLRIFSSLLLGIAFVGLIAVALQDVVDEINRKFLVLDKTKLPIASEFDELYEILRNL